VQKAGKLITDIHSPADMAEKLKSTKDGSIDLLIISGHGNGKDGVVCNSGQCIDGDMDPKVMAAIRQKLRRGAIVRIASCENGTNASSMQKLATGLNAIVEASLGCVFFGGDQATKPWLYWAPGNDEGTPGSQTFPPKSQVRWPPRRP